mmetsp:Transcript_64051/g.113952  ORF Transcript_64051/g.113952 Transcript_64051/m.113952 type:complete len:101 (-) Transcript_64051:2824-3126(-)
MEKSNGGGSTAAAAKVPQGMDGHCAAPLGLVAVLEERHSDSLATQASETPLALEGRNSSPWHSEEGDAGLEKSCRGDGSRSAEAFAILRGFLAGHPQGIE